MRTERWPRRGAKRHEEEPLCGSLRLIVGVLLLLLCGCGDPYWSYYTRSKPTMDDIVGEYVPNKNTRDFILKHYPDADTKLVFRADGTFVAHRIPDCWMAEWGEPRGDYDSGSGTWMIEQQQQFWGLRLGFGPIKDFSAKNQAACTRTVTNRTGSVRTWNAALRNGLSTQAFLIREKPPYAIRLIIGDPDNGEGLQYERRQSPESSKTGR